MADAISINADCPFLNLPPELRNYIYELVLLRPNSITVASSMDNEAAAQVTLKAVLQPALTRTCRQLRVDGLPVFYGGNTFEIYLHFPDPAHGYRGYAKGVPQQTPVQQCHTRIRPAFTSVAAWLGNLSVKHREMVGHLVICTRESRSRLANAADYVGARVSAEVRLRLDGETSGGPSVASWPGGESLKYYKLLIESHGDQSP